MPRKAAKSQARQRGTIVAEGEGKWRVRLYTGTDENGKRQYASKLVVGTISQAQRVRTQMVREHDTQTLAQPTGETVKQFISRYLSDVKANAVLAATLRGYSIQYRTHIVPDLGAIKLEHLTSVRIQQWIASLVDKGLSYSSIRHAYVVLDMALDQAVTWKMLSHNPATSVVLPAKLKADEPEMQTFDGEQTHRFLAGIDTARASYQRYKLYFYMQLLGGLRPGETCALRWTDFNLSAGTVTIVRALTQVTSGHWDVKHCPKTSSGFRTITLPKAVLDQISAHRAFQAAERLAAGPSWESGDYVFTTKTGHYLAPNNVSRVWKALCKHAGVPAIRLYDARHTATTLELEAGVDPKTISQRRGHASVAFTMDRYAHVLKAMDQGAADALDGVFSLHQHNSKQAVSNG